MIWFWLAVGAVLGAYLMYLNRAQVSPKVHCPHCKAVGTVSTQRVQRKQGISGGKATGALMTGGASMLATGLSRKQMVTHMRCGSCLVEWDVA